MQQSLKELEESIGYHFRDSALLERALTHSSYANEHRLGHEGCNERLEFLGDAVLECFSSEYLFRHYPDMPEGDMTKTRASLVCEPTLALCADEFGLGSYLLLGRGEEMNGGRSRDSVVSDAFEALIGAIWLDGGPEEAKAFVVRFVMGDMEHKKLFYDSKTILQERVAGTIQEPVSYRILSEEGPDHDKVYTAAVMIGETEAGRGKGRSKKAAEQKAAYQALIAMTGDRGRR